MRTLFIYLVLAVCASVMQAQEITELKEAKVGFAPLSSEVTRDGDSYSFKVNEAYTGEFENDAIGFMNAYFDIDNFIASVEDENYIAYQVNFVSRKGQLTADFDESGNLTKTSQRFKNILLPAEIREDLYRDHPGWTMVKNVRRSHGSNGLIEKEMYRIKLKNGSSTKIVKIDGLQTDRSEVASR